MKAFSKPLAGFVSAITGALLVCVLFHLTLWGKDSAPNISVSNTLISRDARLGTSFAPVVKKAAPSVVTIYSSRTVRVQPMQNPFHNNPMFRQFFGDQYDDQPRTRHEGGLGSGVIVSPDGYILTANHVVNGADEIKVSLSDDNKKEYIAKIIGTDPQTDVAVLKIDAKDLPAITLADSDQLEIGDVVLAIGNPLGLGQSVTMGIVSGLGRHYGVNGAYGYENFIQTDAAINKGNSGGALVDAEGRLVGINTWIASLGGGNEGLGFAVPVNLARRSMESLIKGGRVTRGFLGLLNLEDITPEFQQQFNLPNQNGALVGDVLPGTPAEKAGIKAGDVIISFNGVDVPDVHGLQLAVSQCEPGSPATVKLIRDGAQRSLSVTLAALPGQGGSESDQSNPDTDTSTTDALDGVTVADLDRDVRQELKIPDSVQGAVVTDVAQDSNSADAGLQKGDVIVQINRQPVSDSDSAVKLCKEAKGDQILVKVWRRNGDMAGTRFLSVDNTKREKK
jgi:serine protease Do